MRFAQGLAQLDLYRNRRFKMRGVPEGVHAADAFVYRMGGIRGGEPVAPRLRHDAVFRADTEQPLDAHVDAILNQLFPKALGTSNQIYDLDLCQVTGAVSIGRPGTEGEAVLPAEFVPSGTTMPRILGLTRGTSDETTLSSVIKTWLKDQAIGLGHDFLRQF